MMDNENMRELRKLEIQVQTKISELRSKGYSDDKILKHLETDEVYMKYDKLSDELLEMILEEL